MKFFIPLFCLLFLSSAHFLHAKSKQVPKNVILIIADGMGPACVTATRIWAKGSKGSLNLEKMPYSGYVKTYSSSGFVTDSAASGTALATGVKTYNRAIAVTDPKVDPKGASRKLELMTEVMKKAGKSVGVVTTTRVTHATPASFYAHVKDRGMEDEIATFVKNSPLDLLMGGGRTHFQRESDKLNLIPELEKSGWTYVTTKEEMAASKGSSLNSKALGIFNRSHITYENKRQVTTKDTEPSLSEMVSFATKFLSDNEKGFFLMVEAGRIDHASHDNLIEEMLYETKELDDCVGGLLGSSLAKDTLIVITADHETAGLAISGYGDVDKVKGDKLLATKKTASGKVSSYISWASGPNGAEGYQSHPAAQYAAEAKHTAIDVMVLASGPGAEVFSGFMNNTQIPRKILAQVELGFESPVNAENPQG